MCISWRIEENARRKTYAGDVCWLVLITFKETPEEQILARCDMYTCIRGCSILGSAGKKEQETDVAN
jgi:hypothetical protein